MVMDRTCGNGNIGARDGVLRGMDVRMVRTGDMWTVVIILIITVIIWWPRKGER